MTNVTSKRVAQSFIALAQNQGHKLTNLRLQRLVIIAHGVHLAYFDAPLFCEKLMAWDFGPVEPLLYNTLQPIGNGVVSESFLGSDVDLLKTHHSCSQAIRATWEAYRSMSDVDIGRCVNANGGPWDIIWRLHEQRYHEIPNGLFKLYYEPMIKKSIEP